jgi:hypothetical protein
MPSSMWRYLKEVSDRLSNRKKELLINTQQLREGRVNVVSGRKERKYVKIKNNGCKGQ